MWEVISPPGPWGGAPHCCPPGKGPSHPPPETGAPQTSPPLSPQAPSMTSRRPARPPHHHHPPPAGSAAAAQRSRPEMQPRYRQHVGGRLGLAAEWGQGGSPLGGEVGQAGHFSARIRALQPLQDSTWLWPCSDGCLTIPTCEMGIEAAAHPTGIAVRATHPVSPPPRTTFAVLSSVASKEKFWTGAALHAHCCARAKCWPISVLTAP